MYDVINPPLSAIFSGSVFVPLSCKEFNEMTDELIVFINDRQNFMSDLSQSAVGHN